MLSAALVVFGGKPGGVPADALTECAPTAPVALTACASASNLSAYAVVSVVAVGTGCGEATVAVGVAGSDRTI